MANWSIYAKKADFDMLSVTHEIDRVIARIMINRDIDPQDFYTFLHPSKDVLYDEKQMKDVTKGAALLAEHIRAGKKIRVIGDYDVDGICATYILKSGILRCGGNVDAAIPHRVEDGYGMNESLVSQAVSDGKDVLVTCDNGISAKEAIALAKEAGLSVIVTDHHGVPTDEQHQQQLPPADIVINPHRQDCHYPFAQICGAVVAWKLIFALYECMGIDRKEAYEFLEMAAFATVADIMPLIDENRSIVALGLQKLRHTKNLGLRALISLCGLEGEVISTYHLGFVLGPCFNATGRLDRADRALELLETKNYEEAHRLATELISLNEERKTMTAEGLDVAIETIESTALTKDKVLVVHLPSLHESLCGIIAGRLRERYCRPVFVLTDGENETKGSGRSIPSYSMFEKMQECKELLKKFGGHPMAAGLSIMRENVGDFRNALNEKCELCEDDLDEKIMIDVAVPLTYLNLQLVRQLEILEPFGNANEKPLFAQKALPVLRAFYIGRQQQYLKFLFPLQEGTIEGLYFGDSKAFCEEIAECFGEDVWEATCEGNVSAPNQIMMDIAYYPQINSYKGTETLQVVIRHYRLVKPTHE